MKRVILSMLAVSAFVFTSCSSDSDEKPPVKPVQAPETYVFKNDKGESTVSFSGQTARLKMASELKTALGKDGLTSSLDMLNKMYTEGKGFSEESLNTSGKVLKGTIASATNSILSSADSDNLRNKVEGWIKEFAEVVIPAKDTDAAKGVAGNLDQKRYVNANGVEANQAVAKTMIGAIMIDQIVNKYISEKYLDDAKEAHEAGTPYKEGKNYTKLEHGWDEAYGYVFGLEENPAAPTLESSNNFLGKYLKKVSKDEDFKGTFENVYNAFKVGRAAIVAKNYDVMHKQAEILRTELSKVVAVKTVYYLLKGKGTRDASTLHALSEAYGFAHAMMFAHAGGQQIGTRMQSIIDALEAEGGLWTVTDEKLDELAKKLASYYSFTPEQTL